MTVIESSEAVEFASEEIIDPIEVICTGTCESLSGRSDLTFAIGRHTELGSLYIALTGNSGKGMFSSQFISGAAIQDIALGSDEISGQNLKGACQKFCV